MSATHQGTCPICHHQQKIVARNTRSGSGAKREGMAKHGYRRPNGWHQEVGGCWGTGKTPWEESPKDAVRYIAEVLNPASAEKRAYADRIDAGEEKVLYFGEHGGASITVTAEAVTVTRKWTTTNVEAAAKAAAERWTNDLRWTAGQAADWPTLSTWDRARRRKAVEIRRIAAAIETEVKFLQREIDAWKPGTLRAVQPEVAPSIGVQLKDGEQAIVREARRGFHGQTRFEVWNGKGWQRAPLAAIKPLLAAKTARWLAPGEKLVAAS